MLLSDITPSDIGAALVFVGTVLLVILKYVPPKVLLHLLGITLADLTDGKIDIQELTVMINYVRSQTTTESTDDKREKIP